MAEDTPQDAWDKPAPASDLEKRQPLGDSPPSSSNVPVFGPQQDVVRPAGLDDRDKKFALYLEARLEKRMVNIIRQESGDSYAGLPADHVLVNLNDQFPEVRFPERMMVRLEAEQAGRLDHERRQDELQMYEAETRRTDAAEDRRLANRSANRAFLVLILLVGAGMVLTLMGEEAAGIAILGTSLVGVMAAFLGQQWKGQGPV